MSRQPINIYGLNSVQEPDHELEAAFYFILFFKNRTKTGPQRFHFFLKNWNLNQTHSNFLYETKTSYKSRTTQHWYMAGVD